MIDNFEGVSREGNNSLRMDFCNFINWVTKWGRSCSLCSKKTTKTIKSNPKTSKKCIRSLIERYLLSPSTPNLCPKSKIQKFSQTKGFNLLGLIPSPASDSKIYTYIQCWFLSTLFLYIQSYLILLINQINTPTQKSHTLDKLRILGNWSGNLSYFMVYSF